MSDLHEDDVVAWSCRQAGLLRRVAAGERIDDQVDWPNVIDEIESVGTEQIHAVRSLLMRALAHELQCEVWPLSREVPHWRAEARRFRIDAADRFTRTMRRAIDVEVLYRRARRLLPDTIDGNPPLPVPEECPMTLDALLAEEP